LYVPKQTLFSSNLLIVKIFKIVYLKGEKMAVPKKRTSKAKTRTRRAIWKKKAQKQVNKLLSTQLAKN